MKRDPRLRRLSADHHRALVLARRLQTEPPSLALATLLWTTFERELLPHFELEEALLLGPLGGFPDERALVRRIEEDHAFFRAEATAASAGRTEGLRGFGERLVDHVRFEERLLFPRCEALLEDALLEEVARRSRG